MGAGGTRRIWKSALLVAIGAAGGGAALAVASVPGSDGVIHACIGLQQDGAPFSEGANVRVIDPSAGQSCTTTSPAGAPTEANLTWNLQGPTGPRGARGAQGRSATVTGGNVITIAGTAITVVGSSHSVTIRTPPLTSRSKPVGTLTLELGRSKLTAPIFSYNLGTGAHGGGGGAGKTSVQEIVITKKLDKSSTKLIRACATGEHIRGAIIVVRKADKGPQKFLVVKLNTVVISSYQTGGSGGPAPSESVSLNFSKIKIDYQPQKPDGT